jgi:hypothetical protein
MASWSSWDRVRWNRELFLSYFATTDLDAPDVTSLSVSAEDLRRVTGDPLANPDEVKAAFLKSINGSLKGDRKGAKFKKAMVGSGMHQGIPLCFSYLYVTCLAANEILENEDNDGSSKKYLGEFRKILAELLEIDDVTLDASLAETWEKLSDFLDVNESVIDLDGVTQNLRKLKLPDPGLEVQIGYSKRLVFPTRRDQENLAKVLRDADLLEDAPPIDHVLTSVTKHKNVFSNQFLNAFEEFASARRNGESSSSLLQLRFWTAVISTCTNEILGSDNSKARISILVDPLGGSEFDFRLVASAGQIPEGYSSVPIEDEEWSQLLLSEEDEGATILKVLSDPKGLGSLTRIVRGGVIPFALRPDRSLEIPKTSDVSEARWFLINKACFDDMERIFGKVAIRDSLESPNTDWVFVSGLRLHALGIDEIEGTSLSKASILLKRVVRPNLKIPSLFSIGHEYLGWKELLPRIEAPGADSVSLKVSGSVVNLTRSGDTWKIAPEKYLGTAIVEAAYGKEIIRKSFEFVEVPASGEYKSPSNPDSLMIEVDRGSDVLSRALSVSTVSSCQQITNSVHRVYLGARPGEFLSESLNASIQISYYGSEVVPIILKPLNLENQKIRVSDNGLVRKWRQEIERASTNEALAEEDRRILSAMKSKNVFEGQCEPVGGYLRPPTPYEDDEKISVQRDALLAALAVRSLRSKGVSISQWISMLKEHFSLDWKFTRLVHRSWLESGVIDQYSSTNSPGLKVFARRPQLLIFQTEDAYIGAITGLVMPGVLKRIREEAIKLSLSPAMNFGPSALVPPHLRLKSSSEIDLKNFAAVFNLETRYLEQNPFSRKMHREYGQHPENGYRMRSFSPTFPVPNKVTLSAFESSRMPMFWTVQNEGTLAWSYSQNHAEYLVCHMAGLPNLKRVSAVDLVAESAFIPFDTARWIVIVSGVPSGPDVKLGYHYRLPSPEMTDSFMRSYQMEASECLRIWSDEPEMRELNA